MDSNTYADNFDASRREHWWFSGRQKVLAVALDTVSGGRASIRILDYGAGTGANFPLFRKYGTVTGVEPSAEARALARKDSIDLYSPEDLGRLNKFDVVALIDVIEHVDDDALLMRELADRLNADGKLVVTVPAHPILWNYNDLVSQHKRRYSKAAFLSAIDRAGLKVDSISYWNFTLLPAALLAALIDYKKARSAVDLTAENVYLKKPGKVLNWLFGRILRLEALWLKMGFKLPSGISLIATVSKA